MLFRSGSAFQGYKGLTSITIPDSVTSIGGSAFSGCTSLTNVTVGSGVTSIGNSAFYGCTGLTSITIPDSVTSVGNAAFCDCNNLKDVYYNGNVAGWCNIDWYFMSAMRSHLLDYADNLYINNELVRDVIIPEGVTRIPNAAFTYYKSLRSVTIPSSVTSIGSYAFTGCTNLEAVYITDLSAWLNIPFYHNSYPNYILPYAHNLYVNGVLAVEIAIPDGVTNIGNYAFAGCTSLRRITIPDSVMSIGDNAFEGCRGLIEVYNQSALNIAKGSTENGRIGYYAKNVYTDPAESKLIIDENGYLIYTNDSEGKILIDYVGNETVLILPADIAKVDSNAFSGRTDLSVIIGSGATSIGDGEFSCCTGLRSVTIGNGVTSIGNSAFYHCTGLTSITIPDSVTSIGGEAFRDCTGLTSVTIPNGVTSIGTYAFSDCTGLRSITIGNGVTSIGHFAFYDCTDLISITYQGTKAQWSAISKGSYWDRNTGNYTIHCTDGDIAKS